MFSSPTIRFTKYSSVLGYWLAANTWRDSLSKAVRMLKRVSRLLFAPIGGHHLALIQACRENFYGAKWRTKRRMVESIISKWTPALRHCRIRSPFFKPRMEGDNVLR